MKRYGEGFFDEGMVVLNDGEFVLHSDYLSLRAALKEALDGWEGFGKAAAMEPDWPKWKRIAELKQFLEDS